MRRLNRHHMPDAADFAGNTASAASPPSHSIRPLVDNIPDEMQRLIRWVVWRYEVRNGKGTKVPYNARTGAKAASDDPQTWSSFRQALDAFHRGGWSGIGFVLGDGWTGIDIDHCIHAETAQIHPEATRIIDEVKSYTEKSPSGTGIHIIVHATLPPGRRRVGNVEMYDGGRYFTITGDLIGDYRTVEDRQTEVETLHGRVFGQAQFPSEVKADTTDQTASATEGLFLNPTAEPPFDRFHMLCEIEPKFKLAWEHRRPDLKDQSQSAYDLALAYYAALVSWTDQEIINMLIANRRKFGTDLKLRQDYYSRTIARARESAEPHILDLKLASLVDPKGSQQASEEGIKAESATGEDGKYSTDEHGSDASVDEAGGEREERDAGRSGQNAPADGHSAEDGPGATQPQGTQSRDKTTILTVLSARFKVPITRIVKFTGEPALYRLETALGNVQLGGVAGLINQSKLRISIADATGRYVPHIDPDVWPNVAQALLDACESVDRGQDATLRGTISEWLRGYLREKSIHPTLVEADEGREPFWDGDTVVIFSSDFRRWLQVRQNERVAQGKLTADLRAFGAEPETFKLPEKQTTRSGWRLPQGPWIPSTG